MVKEKSGNNPNNIKPCGKKYWCKEVEATTWCNEMFLCPKCVKEVE